MKNKILLIVLAIAIFIPTVVAIVSYNTTNTEPVSERNVRAVTLSDLSGKTYTFARGENDTMLDFFLDLNRSSVKVSSLPDPLVGTPFFKLTMLSSKNEESFQYYFAKNTNEAYYLDSNGTAYKIPASFVQQFVGSKYAACLYDAATVPVLSVSGQADVAPHAAAWFFKNTAGTYVSTDVTVSKEPISLALTGGLSFSFTQLPDYCNVKLTDVDTGAVLFDDIYENLYTLSIKKSVNLKAEITAQWFEDAVREYYGELRYSFEARIAAPAGFTLGRTEIQNGEFTVVSAANVADPSAITFASYPDIGYEPVFIKDGELVVALIPFRQELSAGNYTLSFTYGGLTEELTVSVKARESRKYTYQIDKATLNATRTDATKAEFQTAVADVVATYETTRLWDGIFLAAVDKIGQYDGVITLGFGHERTISLTGEKYLHEGVDYATAKDREVRAANTGKVVFAGFTALGGNTVIIEHGYGLKTWYSHLSVMKVSVGDTVTKGATVGIAGKTGFTNQTGVHEGMTVFGVPVSPYPSWDEAILIPGM